MPRDEARTGPAAATGGGAAAASSSSSGAGGEQLGKIYVGGLGENCTEQKVRDYFAQFGPIRNVTLMYDRVSHRPRGFGFIIFESYSHAQKAWGSHPDLGRMVTRQLKNTNMYIHISNTDINVYIQ